MIIIQSEKFDIQVKECNNWLNEKKKYLVIYGLQVTKHNNIRDAMTVFKCSLDHAIDCEGYND